MKFGYRLAIAFASVIALMLFVSLVGIVRVERLSQEVRRMTDTLYPRTVMANAVKGSLNDVSRSMRNVLFLSVATEVQAELDAIGRADASIAENLAAFERLSLTDEEAQLLRDVQAAQKVHAEKLQVYLKLVRDGDVEQARDLALPDLAPHQVRYFEALDRLVAHEGGLMAAAGEQAQDLSRNTRWVLTGAALVSVVLAVVVGLLVTRGITQPLAAAVALTRRVAGGDLTADIAARGRDETSELLRALSDMNHGLGRAVREVRAGTDAIASASREIAEGNADLSVRTEHQSASLEETASAMEQLTATVHHNAENAQRASMLADEASGRAGHGGKIVGDVVEVMGAIVRSSSRIGDITGVIDGIAFQTNILALNAAVEAARAGEQGRGFAVVASEVRTLAGRSAEAAREIKALIEASASEVARGGELVAHARSAMGDIVGSVVQVATIMGEITAASAEQSRGLGEINNAVARMDEMTRQNAALVEQAAAAADAMRGQAAALAQSVAAFHLPPEVDDAPPQAYGLLTGCEAVAALA